MNELNLLNNPIFFDRNRVWRCYLGGKLLDEFTGNPNGTDGNFPEDWLASVTRSDNGEQQQSPDEGLSRIRGSGMHFSNLLQRFPGAALGPEHADGLGVLCKFLDSSIRLPVQCHPDRDFSRKYFNSEHGKTESWLILATREINGEKPYILLGFKPDATPEQFRRAVMVQDIPAMTACLHKFPVKTGDVYFIPGRIPHAIGPGLMLLEVQEPTDLVIQPERQIGKITLSEQQMWAGLDHDTAFSCFDYDGAPAEKLLARLRLKPQLKNEWPNARLENMIGPQNTDCFSVDKLIFSGEFEMTCAAPWYLGVVTSGIGTVSAASSQPFHCGDNFFVSNQIKQLYFQANMPVELYLISIGNP